MTTRLADGNIGNDDGVKLANRIPPLLNWITSDNTDKHKLNACIGIRSLISCDLFCPKSPTDVPFLTSSPLNTCFLELFPLSKK
jgi:hypothetical protein